jgi:aminoglycoside phosphotransferase (APT) family kinase protein
MIDRAAAVWPRLMAEAGIDPGGAVVAVTVERRTPTLEHLILHLRSAAGREVIFKQIRRPTDAAHFAGIVGAQDRASRRMAEEPFARVPAILAVDHGEQAVLMEKVPGDTVQRLIDDGADVRAVLRDAGRWMAAFHRAPEMERRPFRPHFMADHLGLLARQVEAGEKRVPVRGEFLRHVAAVREMAPAFAGKPRLSSVRHGDLHTRNIILGEGRAFGIDFHPPGGAPVGFDIARFLLDHAERQARVEDIPPGHVAPPDAVAAFFDGYDLVPPDDAGVTFLMRVRMLTNWAAMPPSRTVMNLLQMGRFARLRALADNALGG